MRYICAQPAILYYSWQIDIMIASFLKNGVNQNMIDIVFADQINNTYYCDILKNKYPEVNFYFYPDTRIDKFYVSSIRPHILKKHFAKYPHLYKGVFMYHDCDIALTKPLEIEKYLYDDVCYLSDTKSYIGYDYIMGKGEDIFQRMIRTFNINADCVKENQDNSGGAQYVLKDINSFFWEKVEKDCVQLYKNITAMNKKKKALNPDYHELQIWCSDMWAVLWNLWIFGKKTKIIKELDFVWATEPIHYWDIKSIYHNAGVINSNTGLFYKGQWTGQLPPKDLIIDETKSSFNYYKLLKETL